MKLHGPNRKPGKSQGKWLLDPGDRILSERVAGFVNELREFEGRKYGEFFQEIEEKNRLEKLESVRKLRFEVAHLLTGTNTGRTVYADVTPADIRLFVFENLWNRGKSFITSETDLFNPAVEQIIDEAADYYNFTRSELWSMFHADIPEEQNIVVSGIPEPAVIIRMLNTARLKQILRNAVSLIVRIPGSVNRNSPYVSLLWDLKRFGLMYDVRSESNEIVLNITGPLSLFEKTTVYGNRFASFVVRVIGHFGDTDAGDEFRIEAALQGGKAKKLAGIGSVLSIDSSYTDFFARYDLQVEDKLLRSGDETAFQKYFGKAIPDWDAVYEGTLVPLKNAEGKTAGVFVPDFVLRHTQTGREILVEIVGYWREEYLKRKIEKMKLLRGMEVYFFINAQLKAGGGLMEIEKELAPNVRVRFYSGRRDLKRAVMEMADQMN